mmetsp:Transcript_89709/g.249462  ORF Transcript_89709/g.249462 Transcript_89709/m.249462 type:complete len:200 (-) Transcript_89709:331-930(-)
MRPPSACWAEMRSSTSCLAAASSGAAPFAGGRKPGSSWRAPACCAICAPRTALSPVPTCPNASVAGCAAERPKHQRSHRSAPSSAIAQPEPRNMPKGPLSTVPPPSRRVRWRQSRSLWGAFPAEPSAPPRAASWDASQTRPSPIGSAVKGHHHIAGFGPSTERRLAKTPWSYLDLSPSCPTSHLTSQYSMVVRFLLSSQ